LVFPQKQSALAEIKKELRWWTLTTSLLNRAFKESCEAFAISSLQGILSSNWISFPVLLGKSVLCDDIIHAGEVILGVALIETISITQFIHAIRKLPSDEPLVDSRVWYKTQKEHWLEWLNGYHGPGGYGRKVDKERDARFAYNHIINFEMLLWIIDAAGVKPNLVKAARRVSVHGSTLQQKSAAIRKLVPWQELANALWVKKR